MIHVATTWVLDPNQGVVAQSELRKTCWKVDRCSGRLQEAVRSRNTVATDHMEGSDVKVQCSSGRRHWWPWQT